MNALDNPAIHSLARVALELDEWLVKTMKHYNDLQYGKGAMRELRNTCFCEILRLCAPGQRATLQFYHEPRKTWSFPRHMSEIILVFTKSGEAAVSYSVSTDQTWAVCFERPQSGFLVLANNGVTHGQED